MYEAVGGGAFFGALVDRFYDGVAADPNLRPLYPDDLAGPRRDLTEFLVQYWGGPTDYSDRKGHPRLRMRHGGFGIGPAERDAWLHHMTAAVEASTATADQRTQLLDYFGMAATHLVNQP